MACRATSRQPVAALAPASTALIANVRTVSTTSATVVGVRLKIDALGPSESAAARLACRTRIRLRTGGTLHSRGWESEGVCIVPTED
ncbi:hypothetical protein CC85DRAFT_287303 [Cutaneotrichosporon oleaginosum]|uniref:Uncharacterized protein n=1 Tax=Cutaneotrichosporon oleaginosum TaxID=879819 RepID=A0A0J0XHU3_9TREE|nr:uncharacterized protein CC85DRAFT_287303 [Cutaneotrichosporon oleaginosum]KLT40577.1 hypothetical protein CC85DRAFT_287303 [Cutaneotrichosporon oleaginosum]TXT03903.1 hypothetical protein COLE_07600 [Cutaneotrichosporon oleaginosum]